MRFPAALAVLCLTLGSCASTGPSPEEYFNLGKAYFDLGKYAEAEVWYRKAVSGRSTRNAALYQLGRVACEQKRDADAVDIFEGLLEEDPENVTLLRATAFALIAAGKSGKALALYEKLLTLVPDSTEERYNHALALYGLKMYDKSLEMMKAEAVAFPDNRDVKLLLARSHLALGHPEAIDLLTEWLVKGDDPRVRWELGGALLEAGLYAKAVETFEAILSGKKEDQVQARKGEVRFKKATALILGEDEKGETELDQAVKDGFDDEDAVAALRAKITVHASPAATPADGKLPAAPPDARKPDSSMPPPPSS